MVGIDTNVLGMVGIVTNVLGMVGIITTVLGMVAIDNMSHKYQQLSRTAQLHTSCTVVTPPAQSAFSSK
jgi:hypothetical protein